MQNSQLRSCHEILNDANRLQALKDSGLMDSPAEETLDRLNKLASQILKAPISVFTVMSSDRQYYKSAYGLPPGVPVGTSFPMSDTVCQYALEADHLAIEDTKNHPAFAKNDPIQLFQIGGYLGVPVATKSGLIVGTVCVFDFATRVWSDEEIENLKIIAHSFMTEVELRTALKKAEESVKNREDFLSTATHEMKTPLTSLRLHAEIAERKMNRGDLKQDQIDKLCRHFKHECAKLSLIIDDLFDASRMSNGKFTLNRAPQSMTKLLGQTLEGFNFQLENAHCDLELDQAEDMVADCDSLRVEQVLTNILSNAIKYAPGSPIKVTLNRDEQTEMVKISISDSGPGLSVEAQEMIFDPYKRFNKDNFVSGLGLGMYISKKIMQEHGGDLIVESSEGHGAMFSVLLPSCGQDSFA